MPSVGLQSPMATLISMPEHVQKPRSARTRHDWELLQGAASKYSLKDPVVRARTAAGQAVVQEHSTAPGWDNVACCVIMPSYNHQYTVHTRLSLTLVPAINAHACRPGVWPLIGERSWHGRTPFPRDRLTQPYTIVEHAI